MIEVMQVATWDVRGITHSVDELNRELKNRKIGTVVI
jgi:hypothetical protein